MSSRIGDTLIEDRKLLIIILNLFAMMKHSVPLLFEFVSVMTTWKIFDISLDCKLRIGISHSCILYNGVDLTNCKEW